LEGIADELAEAVYVSDVPKADMLGSARMDKLADECRGSRLDKSPAKEDAALVWKANTRIGNLGVTASLCLASFWEDACYVISSHGQA
jgi:hypothetical protein